MGQKGDRGVSITDFTLDDEGNAVTTFDNGKTKTSKLTSIASASASAKKAATSESNAKGYADKALASETNAKTSETNAATYADNAKKSEIAAKASEVNAKASEKSAKSSEEISSTKAEEALASATSASNSATKASESELNAAKSAESASASAIAAASSASSASTSAANASKSATAASSSAINAASSATSASASASSAASSAASASDSKDKASEYKTSASGSATAAASSASSANTSATNAKAAMNTANTAASSASTSAANASTSASNAAKAEVAAKTAQAEAEKARNDANSAVTKLTGVMKYAGQVDNYSDLADVTKNKGDVWNIVNADSEHGIKAGDNVAWNGTDWDDLSGTVDLSIYAEKTDYQKTITSATANGATITFNHKDGTTSTATVNNVATATAATNDAKGQKIDTTYEKIADASNVHTSLQNSINGLSTGKQDKLTFDKAPTANSSNPVTSGGIKTVLDTKLDKTGEGASGTWGINITGNANTADLAKAVAWENVSDKPDNFVDTDSTQTITGAKTLTNKTSITTTDDSKSVVPLAVQAPNLSAGHGIYINLGKDGAMYNRYSFGFHYLGNNSPHNYFSFSSYGGPSYIFDCAGNATFPGKVTAPTFSGSLNGNADTATRATQDASGNVITTTYAKKSEIPSVTVKGVKISGSTSNLTPDTSGIVTIPAIPTKVSTFTNDSGYLTTHQDLSGYQTKLTFDSTPTANSSNPVTSDGIKKAIDAKTVDLSNYYTKTQVDTAITNAISAITDGDNKSY